MRNKPSPFAIGERLPGIVYHVLRVRGQSQKHTWKQSEDCEHCLPEKVPAESFLGRCLILSYNIIGF